MPHSVLLALVFVLVSSGCASVAEPRANHITGRVNDPRPRIANRAVAIVAAPLNLAPNVLSNYIVGLVPGNAWPIQYLLWPVSGLVWGIQDAFLGYPFWSPSALYE